MADLVVVKGIDEGRKFTLGPGASPIGRDPTALIRLNDTEVSRNHAEILFTQDGFRLRDLASVNGSFVNCKSIQDVLLRTGDQVQVGQTVFLFLCHEDHAGDGVNKEDLFPEAVQGEEFFRTFSLLEKVPDSVGSMVLSDPEKVQGPWLRSALVRLGAIYETIQASSQILDVNLLLERILQLMVKTIAAERGCFLIKKESELSAERHEDQGILTTTFENLEEACHLDGEESLAPLIVSRTVVDHVLREKIGVLVTDAPKDLRFASAQSIISTGVREIICVPVRGRHITLGVLYLDSRRGPEGKQAANLKTGFTRDHLTLAIAIAHQAALAVEDTIHYRARIQNERLAGVGETVAYLSHHIKNILQGLKSGGEILKLGLKDRDDAMLSQGIRLIEKNHARIFDLVMEMLNYSKERTPVKTRVDVGELCQEVVELTTQLAKDKNVELEFQPSQEPIFADLDSEAIHRALLNLVNNAIDALEEKGYGKVWVKVERQQNLVVIRVLDDGPGIPEGMGGKMFQPFQSSKGGKGTGLGLAVTKKIITEHKGWIRIESQPGKGAEFCLGLPLSQ